MIDTIRFQLFLATFAGWVCRKQTSMITYLIEENRVASDYPIVLPESLLQQA